MTAILPFPGGNPAPSFTIILRDQWIALVADITRDLARPNWIKPEDRQRLADIRQRALDRIAVAVKVAR